MQNQIDHTFEIKCCTFGSRLLKIMKQSGYRQNRKVPTKHGLFFVGSKVLFVVLLFALGLIGCADDDESRCLEGTVDIGKVALGQTPLLDTMANADTLRFRLNDTSTIQLIKRSTNIFAGNKTVFSDERCNVSYTPEVKRVVYSGTVSSILSELRFSASIGLPSKKRTLQIDLGNAPYYYSPGYITYENTYLDLDYPVYPLKLNTLNVNGKDYNNVNLIVSTNGSYLFFSQEHELLEIRMTNGNVLSKIN